MNEKNLADRYCEKCMNFEMCQRTGCSDRKELEQLLKLATPTKPIYSEYDCFDEVDNLIYPTRAECPNCGTEFEFSTWNDEENHHCVCGQRINWK